MRRLLVLLAALCLIGVASAQASRLWANKLAARRDARALVASVRLPSGATRLPARGPTVSSVGVSGHAKWASGESQKAVIAYIRSHPPAGAKLQSWGSNGGSPTVGTELMLLYTWPSVGLELYSRSLWISVDQLSRGRSRVFGTSQSDWIEPRSVSERVPNGVRVVDVTLRVGHAIGGTDHPVTTTHVFRRAADVSSLIAMVDALPTVQRGDEEIGCPAMLAGPASPLLTLTFRAGRARPALARAQVNVYPGRNGASGWNNCDPIQFWIGNTQQTALTSQAFVKQIAKLIGANIS
ncbi:MAG TPA: hypothetical protein VMV16_01625 [Solirubrobacteraceae bacterium]|nr:hypothetical protein [Solirubrobacteraceae bacterium]